MSEPIEVIEVEPARPDPLAGAEVVDVSGEGFDDIEVVEVPSDAFDPLVGAEVIALSDDAAGPTQLLGDLGDVDLTDAVAGAALRLGPGGRWRARPDGYPHEQLAPANTWVIDHNLGYPPGGVVLRDAIGDVVEADFEYPIPASRLVVTFPFGVSIAGTAYLS